MIQIRRSAIVRHSPTQMFDLVNDVDAYPRRFNWCSAARVLARDAQGITASLQVRLGGITQSFTTRNTLDVPSRIEMQLVEGPFKAFIGIWTFQPLSAQTSSSVSVDPAAMQAADRAVSQVSTSSVPAGCKVALAMDFEYAGLMGSVLRAGFQKLADRMVDDFCREADRSYA